MGSVCYHIKNSIMKILPVSSCLENVVGHSNSRYQRYGSIRSYLCILAEISCCSSLAIEIAIWAAVLIFSLCHYYIGCTL